VKAFETSRHFAASPDEVFAAFAAPDRLARWWGPSGFTNTFEVFEFTPGGAWHFTMHGPDGKHYPNESRFVRIEPARSVVLRHENAPHFELAIVLAPEGGGTRVMWTQTFDSAEVAAAVEHIVVPSNEQNLDRWQAELQAGAQT
jgi:uncharacterized protein YndB with AHSA1/START domain